jgi:two-component system response regulator RegA
VVVVEIRRASKAILIVDDDPCSRESLAQWFGRRGWNVQTVERFSQALGAAMASTPDHLVVEQKLSDGSGFDLMLRLRALNPELSGVIVTRYPSITAAVHAIRMGFRDYLSKPVDWNRLAEIYGAAPGVSAGPSDGRLAPTTEAGPDSVSLARVEWEHIHSVLQDCRGNVSAAARALGLHRRSLQRKLRRVSPAPDGRR